MTKIQAIMQTAWTIARSGAAQFGGSPKAYIAAALRMAWNPAPTRKQIAAKLDRAAERAEMVGARGASPKQCWFLAGLIEAGGDAERNDLLRNTNATLTSKNASTLIDMYLADAKRAA